MFIFLIRHGATDALGKTLSGRKPGVHLNDPGRKQATQLAETLSNAAITQIFSSPLERAIETAQPLAERLNLSIQTDEAFHELDFGDWTGCSFSELENDTAWKHWNSTRSTARPPNGEIMLDAQQRFVTELQKLQERFHNARLAIFTHADPLKAVVMFYLGMSLDGYGKFEIHPGSISLISLNPWGAQVRVLNSPADKNLASLFL